MDQKEFARMGGKSSAEKRFSGKSKEEISEEMKQVRAAREVRKAAEQIVDYLNSPESED